MHMMVVYDREEDTQITSGFCCLPRYYKDD